MTAAEPLAESKTNVLHPRCQASHLDWFCRLNEMRGSKKDKEKVQTRPKFTRMEDRVQEGGEAGVSRRSFWPT